MQIDRKKYNPALHDRFKALTVKQPYASKLVTAIRESDGFNYGMKSIEVRSQNTKYRGDLLICSSKSPFIPGYDSGVTVGLVELYDVKRIADFTTEDWKNTRIAPEVIPTIKGGFGWLMRNPRRVVEFPVSGQLGIYNLCYTKDVIVEYPVVMQFDTDDMDLLIKNANNEKRRS